MFCWALDVALGLALPHCCVVWAGALSPGFFGWVFDAAHGLALPLRHASWAVFPLLAGT